VVLSGFSAGYNSEYPSRSHSVEALHDGAAEQPRSKRLQGGCAAEKALKAAVWLSDARRAATSQYVAKVEVLISLCKVQVFDFLAVTHRVLKDALQMHGYSMCSDFGHATH
jgi:hypothetical protein